MSKSDVSRQSSTVSEGISSNQRGKNVQIRRNISKLRTNMDGVVLDVSNLSYSIVLNKVNTTILRNISFHLPEVGFLKLYK